MVEWIIEFFRSSYDELYVATLIVAMFLFLSGLDDLFIDRAFRGKGIGRALMTYLADVAVTHECARFEWMVLDWNTTAIGFYERLGATFLDEWRMCRLHEAEIRSLAAGLTTR